MRKTLEDKIIEKYPIGILVLTLIVFIMGAAIGYWFGQGSACTMAGLQ